MAENWDVVSDQTGFGVRKIYYHKVTGQTTFQKPDHLKTLAEIQRVRMHPSSCSDLSRIYIYKVEMTQKIYLLLISVICRLPPRHRWIIQSIHQMSDSKCSRNLAGMNRKDWVKMKKVCSK
jgi:hypothetical protein